MDKLKILYIDNRDSFAHIIGAYFRMAGADVKIYESDLSLGELEKKPKDMILLGPGPNGPEDAGNYLDVIDRYHEKLPIFGICLGHQALMHYFGQPVKPLDEIVHGRASLIEHDGETIFEGIENPVRFRDSDKGVATLGRYHSLGVKKVPDCFEVSAGYNNIVMAARHRDLPIEGVQFHPESILSMEGNAGRKLVENVVRLYRERIQALREG